MMRQILFSAAALLFCLSAGSPAHAQWALSGNIYYGITFVSSVQPGTTATNLPLGTITLTSTTSMYPGPYTTNGSASATVHQDFTWIGPSNAERTSFQSSLSEESSGSSPMSPTSSSTYTTRGAVNPPYTLSYDAASTSGVFAVIYPTGDTTTTSETATSPLNVTIQDGYPHTATAAAKTTFGAPTTLPYFL